MKKPQNWLLIPAIVITLLAGYLPSSATAQERCEEWVAKVVSVQGNVKARKTGETQWVPVKLNDTYCPGDMIRVQERSRAAVVIPNESILRLDQKTTITFEGIEKERTSLIDMLKGAVHFFSRIRRGLKVATPFVNGFVEGTEFFVKVERDQTFLSVFEGRVAATNEYGSLILASGQSAVAQVGQAPIPRVVVRPRDAVQWALYYPPILGYRPADFPGVNWQAMVRRSIEFYWQGNLTSAFSSLEEVPEDIRDPRFFTYRAGLLLTVGRVDEASVDIERALNLDPRNSHAFALQSIIAVVQNKKDEALELARKALELDSQSTAARVALSYAQQAQFDLKGALDSLQEAVKLAPENALAWARLAELWLSVGYLDRALEAAQKAVTLNPNLARTQTVLGFAYLTQIKTHDSKKAFEKAIELDQAAPLPRLGLGLARIREGDLRTGRGEIEIAASLDPNNSLIRSYLGKAYFEEKRDKPANVQFTIAKELDPLDPTPWFYDAIRKQTINRPVEALHDLQKSIELNDNRAVYRSRLLLDEDLAARSASLGRIYRDLGFEQLALLEGWRSLNTDPANYSAHRFLADTYSALPRHEIARVSELLQSQLLQPINITPVQPQLAESNLFILEGAGPADPAFNEFNPLFYRNRFALQASGVMGENDTLGDELVHSGLWGRFSYSFGQFHYESDGFRENNDLEQDIYNVFAQVSLRHKTTILAEFRYTEREEGDLPLRFDLNGRENFSPNRRKEEQTKSIRIGVRHSISPRSDIIAHLTFLDAEEEARDKDPFTTFDISVEDQGYMAEAQHLFRSELLHLTSGIGHFNADQEESILISLIQPPSPLLDSFTEPDILHTNFYVYANIHYPENFTWTIGGSADFFDDETVDRDQFNPKLGLIWTPIPGTTLRAAGFRALKRTLTSRQTIEPTQVAGFNQFFDDMNGTKAWRYGVGIDQKFSKVIYGGFEYSKRKLEVPFKDLPRGGQITESDWDEKVVRAYLHWIPKSWLALSAEYLFERFERAREFTGEEEILEVDTHRFPLEVSFFNPSGLRAGIKATYIDQDGEFGNSTDGFFPGDDQFWVVDASIGYRLPKRLGLITVGARNLFDEQFKFQDTDLANQVIYPERLIFGKFTLAF